MRQTLGGTNRGWLATLGFIVLLAGAVATVISTGLWVGLTAAIGLRMTRPTPTSHVVGSSAGRFFAATPAVIGVGAVGVVLGLLGLVWLLAQIPRVNAARPFRLHDDPASGLTVCSPRVLSDAVEHDCQNLPGVAGATAVLRGTATQPELTVRLGANDRSDIQQLLHSIRTDVANNLATALETPLKRLAVQVDITEASRTNNTVTL